MMRSMLKDERGNTAIFVLGMMMIMILMFVVVLNFAKALVTKEKATNNAETASFAATSVFYRQIEQTITDYDRIQGRDLAKSIHELQQKIKMWKEQLKQLKDELKDSKDPTDLLKQIAELNDKIDLARQDIQKLNAHPVHPLSSEIHQREVELRANHPNWSDNQIHVNAIDDVLAKDCPKDSELNDQVIQALHDAIDDAKSAAEQSIQDNGGTINGSEMTLFDNGHVKVKTSVSFQTTNDHSFLPEAKETVYETGKGPDLSFVNHLNGWTEVVVQLD